MVTCLSVCCAAREVGLSAGERAQPGAQGGQRRVSDRVAEQRALGLEPSDGRFELLLFRRHGPRIAIHLCSAEMPSGLGGALLQRVQCFR